MVRQYEMMIESHQVSREFQSLHVCLAALVSQFGFGVPVHDTN